MPAGPGVPLLQLLPAAEDPQPQAAAEGEGSEHAGGASELVSRLTFSGNFGAGGAGFTVPAGLEGGRGEDAEQGGEAEPEDEPPPPPTGVQRVLRALPAVAGLLGLLVGLWDACSSELSMFIHHGPCVSSAHTMLDTLTESGGFACLSATSVYVLIALADYPPARARSGAAVALAQAAGALVSKHGAETPYAAQAVLSMLGLGAWFHWAQAADRWSDIHGARPKGARSIK